MEMRRNLLAFAAGAAIALFALLLTRGGDAATPATVPAANPALAQPATQARERTRPKRRRAQAQTTRTVAAPRRSAPTVATPRPADPVTTAPEPQDELPDEEPGPPVSEPVPPQTVPNPDVPDASVAQPGGGAP